MAKTLKLKSKTEYLKYLDTVSKIIDTGVIFDVKEDKLVSLASSLDSTLILHSEYKSDFSFSDTLNIPDVKKLRHVLDTIEEESVDIEVNSNNLQYKGNGVKFKYHLYEEGFITKPSINIDKINKFKFDVKFNLNKATIQRLFKGSTFASETNKIYFYTDGRALMAELTDRARHNTDNFTLSLGEVDFELEPISINLDNVRLLSLLNDDIRVKINTEFGVVVFDIEESNIKLRYIISALTQ